jgi:hypothetical protein
MKAGPLGLHGVSAWRRLRVRLARLVCGEYGNDRDLDERDVEQVHVALGPMARRSASGSTRGRSLDAPRDKGQNW